MIEKTPEQEPNCFVKIFRFLTARPRKPPDYYGVLWKLGGNRKHVHDYLHQTLTGVFYMLAARFRPLVLLFALFVLTNRGGNVVK